MGSKGNRSRQSDQRDLDESAVRAAIAAERTRAGRRAGRALGGAMGRTDAVRRLAGARGGGPHHHGVPLQPAAGDDRHAPSSRQLPPDGRPGRAPRRGGADVRRARRMLAVQCGSPVEAAGRRDTSARSATTSFTASTSRSRSDWTGNPRRSASEWCSARCNPKQVSYFGVDLTGVQLRANDLDWSYGTGEPLTGRRPRPAAGGLRAQASGRAAAGGGGAPLQSLISISLGGIQYSTCARVESGLEHVPLDHMIRNRHG